MIDCEEEAVQSLDNNEMRRQFSAGARAVLDVSLVVCYLLNVFEQIRRAVRLTHAHDKARFNSEIVTSLSRRADVRADELNAFLCPVFTNRSVIIVIISRENARARPVTGVDARQRRTFFCRGKEEKKKKKKQKKPSRLQTLFLCLVVSSA